MNSQIIRPPAYQKPSGGMYCGGQLNLVNAVNTLIELNQIQAGFTDGIENIITHRITPGIAGYYDITGQIVFKNVIADKGYEASLQISGGTYNPSMVFVQSRLGGAGVNLSARFSLSSVILTAANYLELWGESNSGDNTVDVLSYMTFLSVQRVR